MSETVAAYIAMGSNLGDRAGAIDAALKSLDAHGAIAVTAVSSIIETEPVGRARQGRFLNAVAEIETAQEPRRLLEVCLGIEASCGRDRRHEQRWGPRPLDLDLLLYGSRVIDEPGLTVPHPRLHERAFVLRPLAEIAPALVHPVLGETIAKLRDRLGAAAEVGSGPVLGHWVEHPVARGRIADESMPHR
jgi:2-amino-4-hydroxy-6-hydroxymethyldihydropteridine diphosphokinase